MVRRAAVLVLLVSASACAPDPVGRKCDLGAQPEPAEVAVASPALDCVSRTCLRVPLDRTLPAGGDYPTGSTGLCTAVCETDDDCPASPESPCKTGFTCGIPAGNSVGDYCCRKLCVCRDYVDVDDTGHLETPASCDPAVGSNACCNLDGRTGNPDYPGCPL